MNFAEALKTLREAKGLTHEELAARAGIGAWFIKDLEKAAGIPLPEKIAALAKALDVPKQVLLFFATEEKDIAPEKQQVYKQLHNSMKQLILDIVNDEKNNSN